MSSDPQDEQIALDVSQGSTGEFFNMDETGEKKGPLQRYFKIFGPVLDEAKGLIDAFPVMLDVDNTDPMFLAPMGKLLGVNFNEDIPITQAREEVKNAVPWYKRKATFAGNELYGYMISRVNCTSVAYVDNVLITTRNTNSLKYIYNESVDTSDPEKWYNYKLPGDITGYSVDYVHKSYISPRDVTASSEQPGYEAVRAADDAEETQWKPILSDTDSYLRFTFDNAELPTWVRVFGGNGIRDFALEHSYDGVSWYRDAEYRIGCYEIINQYLGIYETGFPTFYTRKANIEATPEERVYTIVIDTNAVGYLEKSVTKTDTVIEVSDSSFLTEGGWLELAQGGYKNVYQIKEIDGNRIELYGKILMPNGFSEYSTFVRRAEATIKYPYGYVLGNADYSGNDLNGLTLTLSIDGISYGITFSGFDTTSTAYEAALFINPYLANGSVEVSGNRLRIVSLSHGSTSSVQITGGTALDELGLIVDIGYGSYDIDRQLGKITIREASFDDQDKIAISFTALEDSNIINQWFSFQVPQFLREPALYWQIKVLDTWGGEIALSEVELHGDEYYPRTYRSERIGLYLDFGTIHQGCDADVCNKPVTEETLAKIRRNSCTAIPAGYEMVVGVLDCHYLEEAEQRINLFESYTDSYDIVSCNGCTTLLPSYQLFIDGIVTVSCITPSESINFSGIYSEVKHEVIWTDCFWTIPGAAPLNSDAWPNLYWNGSRWVIDLGFIPTGLTVPSWAQWVGSTDPCDPKGTYVYSTIGSNTGVTGTSVIITIS